MNTSRRTDSGRRRPALVLWIWLLAIAIVTTGELLPGGSAPLNWVDSTGISDKIQHFSAYLVLAAIPAFGFERRKGVPAALAMIVYGVMLEFLQRLVPGRDFEWLDMAANTLGVLSGIAAGLSLRRSRFRRASAPPGRS